MSSDKMPSVNHFQTKRAAHKLSRQSTSSTINPFAHIAWGQKREDARRGTFPQDHDPDLEAGNGSPISQVQTAPENFSSGALGEENDKEDGHNTKEADSPVGESSGEKHNGETVPPSHSTSNLKQRGTAKATTGQDAPAKEEPDDSGKKKPKKQSRFLRHIEPKHPFTVANQLQRTFLNSWINVLLIAAPIGIALNFTKVTPIVIFVVNFIAIIPLAAMLSFATEEIALRTGETLGGLLNATFGSVQTSLYSRDS
jgi:Ca2+:H+ antiporter